MVLVVMRHLVSQWAPDAPDRRHRRHSAHSRVKIAHSFNGVVQALGGPAASPDSSAGEAASWVVENMSGGGFAALAARADWLTVGALVAAWPEGAQAWMVGAVRRVTRISAHAVHVGVETLSRAPSVLVLQ